MSIYAIGDLHLSFNENKPMDVFGTKWENYEEKIKENWMNTVTEKDLVILPGDFSWSMYLEETYKDFEYLNKLPGRKILLKGNHDYWWTTVTSMKKYLKEKELENIEFLYNNSFEFDNKVIVGTRGWIQSDDEEDIRLVEREIGRLELSIQNGIKEYGNEKEMIVCLHYPPITKMNIQNDIQSPFMEIMKKYNIKKCIYGHLHGASINDAVEGNHEGIELKLVSSDALDFKLYKI